MARPSRSTTYLILKVVLAVLAICKSRTCLRMTVDLRSPYENALIADITIVDARKNCVFAFQVAAANGGAVQRIDSRY